MVIRLATATRDALANAITTRADSGTSAATIKVYSGTQPASANSAASGTLLATFTCSDPSFGASSTGVITLDITPAVTTTGAAAGTAGWFRLEANGATATVLDGSVTASGGGGDMTVDNTSIAVGQTVTITSGTITMPSGE
jgi:hypothetical protein